MVKAFVPAHLRKQTAGSEKKLYGEYDLTAAGGWKLTISNLPSAEKTPEGYKGDEYFYTVEEVPVPGFKVTYANNNGVHDLDDGAIQLTNQKEAGYELPHTGGMGLVPFLLGGLGCTGISVLLLRRKRKA